MVLFILLSNKWVDITATIFTFKSICSIDPKKGASQMEKDIYAQYDEVFTAIEGIRNRLREAISDWEAENSKIESKLDKMDNSYQKAVMLENRKHSKKTIYESAKTLEKLLTYIELTSHQFKTSYQLEMNNDDAWDKFLSSSSQQLKGLSKLIDNLDPPD